MEEITKVNNSNNKLEYEHKKLQIKWLNVMLFIILHWAALYGLYLLLFAAQLKTIVFWYLYGTLSGMGITAGAHRLWSHRTYKAKMPCQVLLMILNCIAGQNDIFVWSRDHRLHHKYTETDADPHNVHRGFFFAHMVSSISKSKMVYLPCCRASSIVTSGLAYGEEASTGDRQRSLSGHERS